MIRGHCLFDIPKALIQTGPYRIKKKDLSQVKRHNRLGSYFTHAIVCPPREKNLLCLISNVQTNGQVGSKILMAKGLSDPVKI